MAQLPSVGAALEECALSALLQYAKNLQASLNQFAGLADPMLKGGEPREGEAPAEPEPAQTVASLQGADSAGASPFRGSSSRTDMQAFVADLKQAEELLAFEAAQATEAERWTKQLGPAFQGVSTDWDGLRKAITWTRRLRECVAIDARWRRRGDMDSGCHGDAPCFSRVASRARTIPARFAQPRISLRRARSATRWQTAARATAGSCFRIA